MKIKFLTTGGTIDKVYFDAKSEFQVGSPQVLEILREANIDFEFEVWHYRLWEIELSPDPSKDEEELRQIVANFERVSMPRHLPFAWRLLARHYRLAGRLDAADQALASGFQIAEKLKNPEYAWPLHAESAELAVARGDIRGAQSQLRRAVQVLRDLSLHFPTQENQDLFLARRDRAAVLQRLRELSA